ncbi:MAG TPA: tetratricopeptide repeat protein [Gemmatimonadales bacterium]|nr:tetratricopeptide repeat protein [Gemmatimonadales bacterium]
MARRDGPAEIDSVDQAYFLRALLVIGPTVLVVLVGIELLLSYRELLPRWVLIGLLVLDVPVVVLITKILHGLTSRMSLDAVGGGSEVPPPSPTYARQEVLLVRGQYAEAAAYYRDYIRVHPEDYEARLRLAELLEKHLKADGEAEQLYLEVRRAKPDERRELAAFQGLIGLYERSGRKDRLKIELARFADRYKGTRYEAEARDRLRELTSE